MLLGEYCYEKLCAFIDHATLPIFAYIAYG